VRLSPRVQGDRRPRSICSLHIRSQESPVRHSRSRFVAPETDAKRPSRKEEMNGLRTIRTAVPLPSRQHSTCGPATAPSILVSALARANVSPKLLLNLQRDLMRDVKSGGFGPRPSSYVVLRVPDVCLLRVFLHNTTKVQHQNKHSGHYSYLVQKDPQKRYVINNTALGSDGC
jgi:hypothetical protein